MRFIKIVRWAEEIRIQYEPDVELDEFESKLRNSQDRDMRAR